MKRIENWNYYENGLNVQNYLMPFWKMENIEANLKQNRSKSCAVKDYFTTLPYTISLTI